MACGSSGKQSLDLNEVVKNIIGKSVLVYIKHVEDKNDKERKYPRVTFVAQSKVNPPQPSGPPITVGSDELLF